MQGHIRFTPGPMGTPKPTRSISRAVRRLQDLAIRRVGVVLTYRAARRMVGEALFRHEPFTPPDSIALATFAFNAAEIAGATLG